MRLWGPGLASMPVAPEGMHPHSHLSGGVSAAAFAGDGTVVLTGGCDGAVIVSRLSGIQVGFDSLCRVIFIYQLHNCRSHRSLLGSTRKAPMTHRLARLHAAMPSLSSSTDDC